MAPRALLLQKHCRSGLQGNGPQSGDADPPPRPSRAMATRRLQPRLQRENLPLRPQIPAPQDGSLAALPALQAHSTIWVWGRGGSWCHRPRLQVHLLAESSPRSPASLRDPRRRSRHRCRALSSPGPTGDGVAIRKQPSLSHSLPRAGHAPCTVLGGLAGQLQPQSQMYVRLEAGQCGVRRAGEPARTRAWPGVGVGKARGSPRGAQERRGGPVSEAVTAPTVSLQPSSQPSACLVQVNYLLK